MIPDDVIPDDPVVRPGTASFQCIADECGARCCRNPYRVDLGEDEVARLAGATDVARVLDERASMILLRQVDDACVLLSEAQRCTAYESRPNGCRDYPFRLERRDGEAVVSRDLNCPGFIGPPMTQAAYRELVERLSRRG